jgi:oligopeptide transport system substrate-binding protein
MVDGKRTGRNVTSGLANPEGWLKGSAMFRRIISFLAAAFAVVLGACDNNPNPAPLKKTRADGSPWVVFNWALTSDPDTLDPQESYDQQSRRVLEPIYDTLLEYHPLKTNPYEVRPCMLAEMPRKEVGPNGELSYVGRLQEGILFHDDPCFPGGKGREVVAEDVHYVFQRMSDPKVGSPFFGPIADAVVGMEEAWAVAKKNQEVFDYDTNKISGVEVLDKYSFRIRLKRPYPQLIYWMAFQCLAPVAREAVEYYDGKEHNGVQRGDFRKFATVGTGPFRLAEYIPRQRVRLERVPTYKTTTFPTDGDIPPEKADLIKSLQGKPLPLVDEVNMSIISEPLPSFILTRQGYLDRMAANKDAFSSLLTPERSLAPRYRDRGMFLEKDAEPSTFWIGLNMEDPVLGKNKKLRQALSCAYDAKTYSEIFMSGVSPVATQLLPPGFFGYDERPNPYGYNFEKAKQLLAEAGYPNGRDAQGRQLELTLQAITDGGEHRQRAEFDQKAFERLGIKVRVGENDFPSLMDKKDKGLFQMNTGSGWGADYSDPENFFFLFYSKNIPPAGKNETRYRNPEFDALFEKMAIMENTPERKDILRKMNEILWEDVPIIYTFNKQFYTVIQPWAKRSHQNHLLEGGIKFQTVDHELRERVRGGWNRRPLWPIAIFLGVAVTALFYAFRWNRRHNA